MKLYPVLKDKTMKYPRAANVTLYCGVALIVAGAFSSVGIVVSLVADVFFFPSICAMVIGALLYVVSEQLEKVKVPPVPHPVSSSRLTRVK